jgi:hypothetical protein
MCKMGAIKGHMYVRALGSTVCIGVSQAQAGGDRVYRPVEKSAASRYVKVLTPLRQLKHVMSSSHFLCLHALTWKYGGSVSAS